MFTCSVPAVNTWRSSSECVLTDCRDVDPPGELQGSASALVLHDAEIWTLVLNYHDVELQAGSSLLPLVVPERMARTILRTRRDKTS